MGDNGGIQLADVPFRLPALIQKPVCNIEEQENLANKQNKYCKRFQATLQHFNENQEYKEISSRLARSSSQMFSGLLCNSYEDDFNKCSNHLPRRFNNMLKSFHNLNSDSNQEERPIWIKDLRKWIENNKNHLEFFKLWSTAIIHGTELTKNLSLKQEEELRKCERFLRHFHEKNFQNRAGKMNLQRASNAKSKHHKWTVRRSHDEMSRIIDRILEVAEEYDIDTFSEDEPMIPNTEANSRTNFQSDENHNLRQENENQNSPIDKSLKTQMDDLDSQDDHIQYQDHIEGKNSTRNSKISHKAKNNHSTHGLQTFSKGSVESTSIQEDNQVQCNAYLSKPDEDKSLTISNGEEFATLPAATEEENNLDELNPNTNEKCGLQNENSTAITPTEYSNPPADENREPFANSQSPPYDLSSNQKKSLSPTRRKREIPHKVILDKSVTMGSEHESVQDMKVEGSFISIEENISREQSIEIKKPVIELPPLPSFEKESKPLKESDSSMISIDNERDKLAPLLKKETRKWGKKNKDLSFMNDMERERLAEERRMRVEKLNKKPKDKKVESSYIPDAPRFESYGFLAKYCILKMTNVSLYHNTFSACDDGGKQYLTNAELILALRGVNPQLKDFDIAYLSMIMKTCDYNLRTGADFKLFAVLAALSIQIATLDSWIRNCIGAIDFKILEKKTYICKQLWEVNVDPSTNTIPLDRLCVELKAGGVKKRHIEEVRQRLGWMRELNLLDYLTYIPLFIIMHMSIIDNPLDMSEKI